VSDNDELRDAIARVREVMPEYEFTPSEKWAFDCVLAAAAQAERDVQRWERRARWVAAQDSPGPDYWAAVDRLIQASLPCGTGQRPIEL
jgi:hypothetical protein